MPKYRRLAPAISPQTPQARVITGVITDVNTTTKTITMDIGPAEIKVRYPSSLVPAPSAGDVLWCLEASGHYWPFAWAAG